MTHLEHMSMKDACEQRQRLQKRLARALARMKREPNQQFVLGVADEHFVVNKFELFGLALVILLSGEVK